MQKTICANPFSLYTLHMVQKGLLWVFLVDLGILSSKSALKFCWQNDFYWQIAQHQKGHFDITSPVCEGQNRGVKMIFPPSFRGKTICRAVREIRVIAMNNPRIGGGRRFFRFLKPPPVCCFFQNRRQPDKEEARALALASRHFNYSFIAPSGRKSRARGSVLSRERQRTSRCSWSSGTR